MFFCLLAFFSGLDPPRPLFHSVVINIVAVFSCVLSVFFLCICCRCCCCCAAIVSATFFVKQKPSQKTKRATRGRRSGRAWTRGAAWAWPRRKGKYIEPKAKGRLTCSKKIKNKKKHTHTGSRRNKKDVEKRTQNREKTRQECMGKAALVRSNALQPLAVCGVHFSIFHFPFAVFHFVLCVFLLPAFWRFVCATRRMSDTTRHGQWTQQGVWRYNGTRHSSGKTLCWPWPWQRQRANLPAALSLASGCCEAPEIRAASSKQKCGNNSCYASDVLLARKPKVESSSHQTSATSRPWPKVVAKSA